MTQLDTRSQAPVPRSSRLAPVVASRIGRLVRADVLAWIGLVILMCVVVAAVFAPWLAPYPDDGTSATHPAQSLLGPSGAHWMGTDLVGRDVFSRVLYGARTSLTIVVSVLAIAATVGVLLGVTAGYAGGLARDAILRVTDIFLAFPALLLSLALAVVLHAGLGTAIIAIAVTWWPWYTRLSVSLASSIRSRGYVEAARCLGVSPVRLVVRHVLPNSLTPVLVQLSLDAGGVILTAAALSYLGLGAQEPMSEWGLMVEQGQSLFTTDWWVVTFPGLAILLTAFGFNVLGEAVRSALDPRRGVR
jgi:peptide/nickel transport system permease protein